MKKNIPTVNQEEQLREKAARYLVCFIDHCTHREDCLRWLAGQYVDSRLICCEAVNPRNELVKSGQCPLHRPAVRVLCQRGMLHFYDQMTGRQEHAIRAQLIQLFNRKYYYQMRNGKRLIDPETQQTIERICRQYGYEGPFVYDGEQEEWDW